jgi:ribokinase
MMGGKLYKEEAYHVNIVDSTAAGDAYIGALISRMIENDDFKNCMNYASRVAALTITKVGAQQSIPYKNEVEDYFKKEGI